MDAVSVIRFLFNRILFIGHGLFSVYLLILLDSNAIYWILAIPMFFLVVEIFSGICNRQFFEFQYFWLTGFFYISIIIPIIWIIELTLFDNRVKARNIALQNITYTSFNNQPTESYFIALKLSQESIQKKVTEIGLIVGLIAGRWVMPRGRLSHDQLSSLLLGYVGIAADNLGLFSTFEHPDMFYEKPVIVCVLAIYTWSIFQFVLITTAVESRESEVQENNTNPQRTKKFKNKVEPIHYVGREAMTIDKIEEYIELIKTNKNTEKRYTRRGKGKSLKRSDSKKLLNPKIPLLDENIQRRDLHSEVFQIFVSLLMLDIPYLLLRLYLTVVYNTFNVMHIFFTCKNGFMSILLMYRLCVLVCKDDGEDTDWYKDEAEYKLQNVQLAVEGEGIITKNSYELSVKQYLDC